MDPDENDLSTHLRATIPAGDGGNQNPNKIEVSGEALAVVRNENASDKLSEIPKPQSSSSTNPNFPEVPVSPTMETVSMDASMKVFLRIRPFMVSPYKSKSLRPSNDRIAWPKSKTGRGEKVKPEKKRTNCIQVSDCHSVTILPPSTLNRMKSEVYRGFSQVFSADSSQEEVYAKTVSHIVEDFLKGKSGLLAALGPSGSGKTHTVFGSARDPGLVPRALRQIFDAFVGSQDKSKRSFYLSMFEIYVDNGKMEKLSDLSPDGGEIQLQQSSLKGLKELLVTDCAQAEALIARGMLKRAVATTNSNSQSSRSQCIISIRCAIDNIDGKVETQVNESVLTFVDLAGSEREKKTGNQGDRLLQSNFINKTSMVFGLCLRSLLEHQKSPKKPLRKHFQSSLLTRYLRDYLEGKKRMALILTVRPAEEDYLDTSFLLRQASPYMEIKFLNKEETSQSKRHHETTFNAVTKQSKRMKTSCLTDSKDKLKVSACPRDTFEELDEGYPRIFLAKPGKVPVSKVNDEITCKTVYADSGKGRDYKILLGVAKSIWSLLKEHNQKIKMLEKRNLELEKELSDLKSCSCASHMEASVEVASLVADTNSETTTSLAELVGHKSPGSDSEGKKDASKDMEKQADMRKSGFESFGFPEEQRSTYLKFEGDMGMQSKPYCYEPVQLPDDHLSAFHEAKQNELVGGVEDCQPTNTMELKRLHICKTESEHPREECQGSPNFEGNMNNEDSYQGLHMIKEDKKEICCDENLSDVSEEIEKQADICKTGYDCPEEQRSTSLRCKGDMEMEAKSYSSEPVRVSGDHTSDFHEAKQNEMVEGVKDCRPCSTKELEKKVHICKTESERPPDECQGSQCCEGNMNNEDSYQGCDLEKEEEKETCSDKNLTEEVDELEKTRVCKTELEHPQDECRGSENFEGNVKNEDSYQGRDSEKEDNLETSSDKYLTEDTKELENKAPTCKTESEQPQDKLQGSQNIQGNVKNEGSYQSRDLEKEDNKEARSYKKLTEDAKELEKKACMCKKESEHPKGESQGSQNFEGNVKKEDPATEDNKETCSDKNLTDEKESEKKVHICKKEPEHPQDECQGSQQFEGNVKNEDSYQGHDLRKEDNKKTCSDKNLTEDAKELEKKVLKCKKEPEHPQDERQGSQHFQGNVKNEDSYQGRDLKKEDNMETCSDKNLTDQTPATVSRRSRRGTNKVEKEKKCITFDGGDNLSTASKPGKTLIPQGITSVKAKPRRRMNPASTSVFVNRLESQDEEVTMGHRSRRTSADDNNRITSNSATLLRLLRVDVHR